MKTIDLGEWTCAYVDEGAGPCIVFLHGFPLNKSMWQPQLELFARTHRVIAPDLRGHGDSTVTQGVVTMRQMADDVAKLLEALDMHGPVTLCGLSMGGYVAWEFWRHYSARLARLILCDTRAAADTQEVARGRQLMAAEVLEAGVGAVVDSMLPKLVSAKTHQDQPALVETLRHMMQAADPRGVAAAQRGMAERIDMTPMLKDVAVPALLLCGTEDKISPPAEMSSLAVAMPCATFVAIPDAGHLATLEQPAAANAAIQHFLGS